MGITDIVKGKGKSRVEVFQDKVKKAKSKEEVRSLEETMLKPAPLLPYTKQQSTKKNPLEDRTILIVFPGTKSVELFRSLFKLSKPPLSVLNVQQFIKMLKLYKKHLAKKEKRHERQKNEG